MQNFIRRNSVWKENLEKPRLRREDSNKICLEETGYGVVSCRS